MPRLLIDHDVDGRLVRAIRARFPDLVLERVRAIGLHRAPDEDLIDEALRSGAILLTRDKSTLVPIAIERMRNGQPVPRIIVIQHGAPLGLAIGDVAVVLATATDADWAVRVIWVPL